MLALTCRHASHTSSLGIANDLSFGLVMRPRFLPAPTGRWLIESTSPMSRPLRSTTTPASSSFTANTSRSASKRLNRYSMPPVSAVGTLPLAARRTDPQARTATFDARLLTFRARAADQAHAASTPGTTWPGTRDPARLVSEDEAGPPILMPSKPFRRLNNARPNPQTNPGFERILERLPGPHLTGSSPAFSPNARHDGLQPTQHRGGLTPTPAGPTPEGQQSLHLSHSTALWSYTYIVLLQRS